MFPEITHIDQVLKAIEGRSEFIVAERPGYKVVDYVFAVADSFDCPIRKECRGIKFDSAGNLLARPFQKFFNIGEKPESSATNIDWSKGHIVMPKRDGSMIHPAFVNGQMLLMTRMGHTDVARKAENFVLWNNTLNFYNLLENCEEAGMTPIFEYTSPDNRIVIGYDKPELTLLAIRNKRTGQYMTPEWTFMIAGQFNIPWVGFGHPPVTDHQAFMVHTAGLKSEEGYVVRFDHGLMVKVKADEYVLRHRAKDAIHLEKNVLALVLDNGVDDVLPGLSVEDAQALEKYRDAVMQQIDAAASTVGATIRSAHDSNADRKTFALEYVAKLDPILKASAFKGWVDSTAIMPALIQAMKGRCGSQTDVDGMAELLGPARWKYSSPVV